MDLQDPWKPTSSPGYEADKRRTFWGPNTQSGLAHSGGTGTVTMVHLSPPPNHLPQEGGHIEGGGWARHSGRGTGEDHDTPNTMVYHPRYENYRWKGLRDRARPMYDVIKSARASELDLPSPLPGSGEEITPFVSYKGTLQIAIQEGGVTLTLPRRG